MTRERRYHVKKTPELSRTASGRTVPGSETGHAGRGPAIMPAPAAAPLSLSLPKAVQAAAQAPPRVQGQVNGTEVDPGLARILQ